jgi:SH3-like domain-containing protein
MLLTLALAAATAVAPVDSDATKGVSGLPVPRYVSLKSDKAYLRTGPGDRYPVSWVYMRKGLPVEVIREYAAASGG